MHEVDESNGSPSPEHRLDRARRLVEATPQMRVFSNGRELMIPIIETTELLAILGEPAKAATCGEMIRLAGPTRGEVITLLCTRERGHALRGHRVSYVGRVIRWFESEDLNSVGQHNTLDIGCVNTTNNVLIAGERCFVCHPREQAERSCGAMTYSTGGDGHMVNARIHCSRVHGHVGWHKGSTANVAEEWAPTESTPTATSVCGTLFRVERGDADPLYCDRTSGHTGWHKTRESIDTTVEWQA